VGEVRGDFQRSEGEEMPASICQTSKKNKGRNQTSQAYHPFREGKRVGAQMMGNVLDGSYGRAKNDGN